ncbi:FG-GAP-like repeat-containing protein [Neolewinella persica]|uniref:FG-GAP-like repeat-containing protein n=1 Tax=Neolewinella persica TaxID=70998 RepID=UPI000475C3DD|nr:FG-GAP-like repeat-containing protein [Neolewinella persica]
MTRTFAIMLWCSFAMLPALTGQAFRDVSEAAGIDAKAIDPIIMAGGAVWFDYNNDRYPDLLLTNGKATTSLFRNNWDGTFADVSESAGLLNVAGTMGAVSGDFDNDGFADLFITTMKSTHNRLLRNNGAGRFIDVSVSAGITETSFGASAATGDYDGDGDLDIYVTNYLAGENAQDGGQPNFLYRNDGNFTFTEVATALELDDDGCGLGAVFSDLNNDGRPDLYVANDFGYLIKPNAYFQNEFPFFSQKAEDNGTAATINAMGIAKGDYDNDGDIDLYITNIRENPLFENDAARSFFSFRSFAAGVALPELTSWGTSFTDFDLDGYLDLIVANGQVAEELNKPEAQRYFHNKGDGTFTDTSVSSGIDDIVMMGRGLAVADYDLDGYPDVAINAVQPDITGSETATLLHNVGTGAGQWLAIEVPVNTLNLTLYTGDQSWFREVDGGSSYLSHSAGPIHFGAPSPGAPIDSLVVTFTDRQTQTFTDLTWNRLMGIRSDGTWYLISHKTRIQCGEAATTPTIDALWQTQANGREELLLTRTETILFPELEEQVVELSVGDIYRGLARTQDAVLVDTIAGDGPCPGLRPVRIKVLPAIGQPLVYPNPIISDQLSLQLPRGGGSLKVNMWTSSGALVFNRFREIATDQRIVPFTMSSLPPGAYLMRLEFAGVVTYHKLIRL